MLGDILTLVVPWLLEEIGLMTVVLETPADDDAMISAAEAGGMSIAVRRREHVVRPGGRVVVLTWLHLADRTVLAVHPRGDASRPLTGVFSTRSQDRPNPVGLHEVEIVDVEPDRLRVRGLEAVDGTPVIDIKPVLEPRGAR